MYNSLPSRSASKASYTDLKTPMDTDGSGTLIRKLWHMRKPRNISSCTDPFSASLMSTTKPLVITRVDQPWIRPIDLRAGLDIGEIIRLKDEHMMDSPRSPMPPASPQSIMSGFSMRTAVNRNSVGMECMTDSLGPPCSPSIDTFRQTASPQARNSMTNDSFGKRKLRHDYFRVATMDGKPTIRNTYTCPIALCRASFEHFEHLQAHWNEHPWNRGGILTPVCDGGVRRLGWWEHKKKFFASLVQGLSAPEFPETAEGGQRKVPRRSRSIDEVCRSDYGDIRLFGKRTYHVSPRVVPMWQVTQWENQRDA
ncbi:hypothetical protein BX661DRAFT_184229 [Kickxella alabastrina]|uniref:uncharacterized protein n=1 Tax=Kickxella alabastrina TaxID=61397 RepID=UPI00221EF5BB|nr:uncharacterized protein BX661DRAFT_184229 [Kickxella alabastrina]KAI7825822.1 hypothetical protein BX661DRAFT_184229 [Kickxella alabastrina]KAJ1934671.1 hypothetical protein GGF37_006280 [Kickxella alabastrina]